MENKFDVIVVGLGAHGSATVYELSKTKYSVLGIDRFTPPHTHGSSHGESRIIRQAYHEHPMYVPLIREAYTLWHELEKTTGKKLLLNTGGLILGREDADIVQGAIASANKYDLPYELLSSPEIVKRFPAFKPTDDTIGVLDATAGILFPEKCIEAFLKEADKNGANLSYNERVLGIDPDADEIKVVTEQNVYLTRKLIISAGAWLDSLMPDLHLPLTVDRQVLHWFKDESESRLFTPERFPIYIWEYNDLGKAFYGFPDLGTGIKAAFHYGGSPIDPDKRSNTVGAEEISDMSDALQTYLDINPQQHYSTVCMYTNTPDQHFILDHHPSNPNIIVASPCSGHGFKFASVVGKILMQLATGERLDFDLSPFKMNRFTS